MGAGATWDLIAPSTCEILDGAGVAALRGDADPERAWARLRAGRGTIGAALLDRSVIAGVGNVFRAEALFACGLHPARPAASLTRPEFDRLWATTRAMMRHSVEEGRIVTFVDPPTGDATRDGAWNVYKRDDCLRCGAPVTSWTLGGRTIYACPVDQPAA